MLGLQDGLLRDALQQHVLPRLTARTLCRLAAASRSLRDIVWSADLSTWQGAARRTLQPCCPHLPGSAGAVRTLLQREAVLNRNLSAGFIVSSSKQTFPYLRGTQTGAHYSLSPNGEVLIDWLKDRGAPLVFWLLSSSPIHSHSVLVDSGHGTDDIFWHPDGVHVTVCHRSLDPGSISFSVLDWHSRAWKSIHTVPGSAEGFEIGPVSPSCTKLVVCDSLVHGDNLGSPPVVAWRIVDVAGCMTVKPSPVEQAWKFEDEFWAAWAPGSDKLAVFGASCLTFVDADTGACHLVSNIYPSFGPAHTDCFFPDGDACIVLMAGEEGGSCTRQYGLTKVNAATLACEVVCMQVCSIDDSNVVSVRVAPGGQTAAVAYYDAEDTGIWLKIADLSAGQPVRSALHCDWEGCAGPLWAPNGRWLALASCFSIKNHLAVLNAYAATQPSCADTSLVRPDHEIRAITLPYEFDKGPHAVAWSADGSKLVVIVLHDLDTDGYRVTVASHTFI